MHALTLQGLTKTYSNGVKALRGIDLQVEKGDFFALLGPNGAGKSTVIGILTSLVNKTSGKVSIFGKDIDTAFDAAKTYIGVVPQEFNFSIFEKVIQILVNQAGYYGVPKKLAMERANYFLKKLGLWDKRFHSARTLSGGMKRRLMIARALIHYPQLLILDEPTAGVDIEIRRSMWQFLTEINQQGITVILTTHYLEEAESLCKNIAIINEGLIIENTSMKSLLNKLDVETFILNVQNKIQHAPSLKHFSCSFIDESTISVDIHQHQSLNELFQALDEHGLTVSSMRNKTNRLEELFVNLTSKNNGD
jgi:ABC-2 type transport system ATP-binding protein